MTDFYAPLDTGRLDSWSLTLHTTAGAPFTVTVNPAYAGPSIPTVDLATVTATVTVAAGSLVHPLSDVRLFAGVSHSRLGDLVIALDVSGRDDRHARHPGTVATWPTCSGARCGATPRSSR